MTRGHGRGLSEVGPARAVAYACLVGGAAYLLAATYVSTGPFERAAVAVAVAVGYVAFVRVVASLKRLPSW